MFIKNLYKTTIAHYLLEIKNNIENIFWILYIFYIYIFHIYCIFICNHPYIIMIINCYRRKIALMIIWFWNSTLLILFAKYFYVLFQGISYLRAYALMNLTANIAWDCICFALRDGDQSSKDFLHLLSLHSDKHW